MKRVEDVGSIGFANMWDGKHLKKDHQEKREQQTETFRRIMERLSEDKSDEELLAGFRRQEKRTGIVMATSPTHIYHGDSVVAELKEVTMKDFYANVTLADSAKDVVDFVSTKTSFARWNVVGQPVELHYAQGKLERAIALRQPDGKGYDVTHTMRHTARMPAQIPAQGTLVVHGVVTITWAHFNDVKKYDGTEYGHPSNLVKKCVFNLDGRICTTHFMEFIAHHLYTDVHGESKSRLYAQLNELGFDTCPIWHFKDFIHEKQVALIEKQYPELRCEYPTEGHVFECDLPCPAAQEKEKDEPSGRQIIREWSKELDIKERIFINRLFADVFGMPIQTH